MYQIIKYSRDCGTDSGREFWRKADAVRYARAYVCPDWEYVAVINTCTKRVDVLKGATMMVHYAPGCTEYKRGKLCAIYRG